MPPEGGSSSLVHCVYCTQEWLQGVICLATSAQGIGVAFGISVFEFIGALATHKYFKLKILVGSVLSQ